jgi:plastocyanin
MKLRYHFFLAVLFVAGTVRATTHTINFGGAIGDRYNPNTLTVAVGDTIIWGGPFEMHTLEATKDGATVIDFGGTTHTPPGAGLTYSYVVPSVGEYLFWCTLHGTPTTGMSGSFTAVASGVESLSATTISLDPLFPNPTVESANLRFTLEKPAHVTLQIFDATGKLIATTADEQMGEGFHMLTIDTKQFASGSYQYVLQAGDAVLRREMVVVK